MRNSANDITEAVRRRLIDGMTAYVKDQFAEPGETPERGYSQEHVDRCAAIIDTYLSKMSSKPRPSHKQILAAVEESVLDLNSLNDECGKTLIETDQREDLCLLILLAATRAGLDIDDDITEKWRQW